MRVIIFTAVFFILQGCSYGYVQSDIPGVAEYLGGKMIDQAAKKKCSQRRPNFSADVYGEQYITEVDLTRTYIEYEFKCIPKANKYKTQ